MIPFPPPRICQGGHYAKPSPEVRRAHGGLISPPPPPPPPFRTKVWAIPFPSRRSQNVEEAFLCIYDYPLCCFYPDVPTAADVGWLSDHAAAAPATSIRGNPERFRKIRRHLEEETSAHSPPVFCVNPLRLPVLRPPDAGRIPRFSWSGRITARGGRNTRDL